MKREVFGHPRGLVYLFGTEMWERFSYYGNRVILPLYLLQYLLLPGHHEQVLGFETVKQLLPYIYGTLTTPQQLQSAIYGAYTMLVYLTPLAGGFMADRWFGRRYTVVAGGILMSIGHFVMAFDNYFYVALLFLILGNGGFKANVSTQIGGLYSPGDHRIDRAYSVFYVGINLGALLGQNICGFFGDEKAWAYGFGAAGVAMLAGTLIYLYALRILPPDMPKKAASPRTPLGSDDWYAIFILLLFFLPGALFWATYEQSGNTMEVWSVDHVNRVVNLGFARFTLTVGNIQSLNSVFILAFTPLVMAYWKRQEIRGDEPSVAVKMALGFVILAMSYFVLAGCEMLAGGGQVHWLWTVLYFAIYTLGELYFSPVGLSLYAKAAPAQVAALMMAVFLGTNCLGNYLAGWLGTFYSVMSNTQFFLFIGLVALAPAPVIWMFDRPLKRIMAAHETRRLTMADMPYQAPVQ